MADPLSDEDLAAMKARAAAATPGPWVYSGGSPEDPTVGYVVHHRTLRWEEFGQGDAYTMQDAAFLAAAREDVPRLVGEVERLQQENARLLALHQDEAERLRRRERELLRVIGTLVRLQGGRVVLPDSLLSREYALTEYPSPADGGQVIEARPPLLLVR